MSQPGRHLDNGMVDRLMRGNSGDWFFADLDGDDKDEISLYEPGEVIDAI